MTIVDRRLECESCHYRFDDFSLLRLHKKQKEGVCESYDVTLEDQYRRKQAFIYTMINEKKPKPDSSGLAHPIRKPSKLPKPEMENKKESNEANERSKEVKIHIGPFKLRMKTVSPVLKCSYCKTEFNIDQDKNASFKLADHVSSEHPTQNYKFRFVKTFTIGMAHSEWVTSFLQDSSFFHFALSV